MFNESATVPGPGPSLPWLFVTAFDRELAERASSCHSSLRSAFAERDWLLSFPDLPVVVVEWAV